MNQMSFFKKFFAVPVLGIAVLVGSCQAEDFSLNGDYEITPVVFGLLDHSKDVHIIKITKAFMGDGDNLVYAQNPDSSYFETVDAKVVEFDDGVATGREWQLHDSIITNKDTSGIFYAPEQKVYVFYESDLDSTMEYELTVIINEGEHEVHGMTELIHGFKVASNVYIMSEIAFAGNTIANDQDYLSWNFQVFEAYNGKRYTYKYTIRWTETYADNSTASFSASRNNGNVEQVDPEVPLSHLASFSGLDFYTWIGSVIPDDPNVIKRKFDGLDLRITVAHNEFDQYLDVSQPVTSIAQVQPIYTNLSGGLGLFSSRQIFELYDFDLNKASRKELCKGSKTGHLWFCSSNPADVGESFYCP